MHRWIDLRSLTAAIALSSLICLPRIALGEPNGGKPATNHEIAIEVPAPVAEEPADADGKLKPGRETGAEPASNEQQPLLKPNDQAAHVTERSIGLMNPDDGERGSSPLSMIPGGERDIIQVVGALAIVITLLLVFRFVMVRASGTLAGSRPSGVLEVLARYPVARGQHLSLIKLGRRILLVHQNGSAMNTLTELSDAEEVAALLSRIEAGSSGRDAARFRSLLTQYQRDHETTITAHAGMQRSEVPGSTRDGRGEIIDLTRSQMGGLRNLFGGKQ